MNAVHEPPLRSGRSTSVRASVSQTDGSVSAQQGRGQGRAARRAGAESTSPGSTATDDPRTVSQKPSRAPSPTGSDSSSRSRHSHANRRVRTEGNRFEPRASHFDTGGGLLHPWVSPRHTDLTAVLEGGSSSVGASESSYRRQSSSEAAGGTACSESGSSAARAAAEGGAPTLLPSTLQQGEAVQESGLRRRHTGPNAPFLGASPPAALSSAEACHPPALTPLEAPAQAQRPLPAIRTPERSSAARAPRPASNDGWFNLIVVLACLYMGSSLLHSRMSVGAWLAGSARAMVETAITIPALVRDVCITGLFYFVFCHVHALMVAAGWMTPKGKAAITLQVLAECGMLGGLILYARSRGHDWPLLGRLALLMEAAVLTMKMHSHISVNRELAVARHKMEKAAQVIAARDRGGGGVNVSPASSPSPSSYPSLTSMNDEGTAAAGSALAALGASEGQSCGLEQQPMPTPTALSVASSNAALGFSWLTKHLRHDAGTDRLDASLGLASPLLSLDAASPSPWPSRTAPGAGLSSTGMQGHTAGFPATEGRLGSAGMRHSGGGGGAVAAALRRTSSRLVTSIRTAWSTANLASLAPSTTPSVAASDDSNVSALAYCLRTFPYPSNLSLYDLTIFTIAPTLVYEPLSVYPRTKKIRPAYIVEKIMVAAALVFMGILLFSNSMSPPLTDVAAAAKAVYRHTAQGKAQGSGSGAPPQKALPAHYEGGVLIDAIARMAIPTTGLMLIIFYVTFECVCNACAELARFGDRGFYDDWWNSTTFAEFSRKWNKPVHEGLLRHVYLGTMGVPSSRVLLEGRWAEGLAEAQRVLHEASASGSGEGAGRSSTGANGGRSSRGGSGGRRKRKTVLSPMTALYLTFLVSIAVHEAILWGVLGWVTPWLALFSLCQFPLLTLLRLPVFRGKRLGNIVFWSGLILGVSTIIVLYAREYALLELEEAEA